MGEQYPHPDDAADSRADAVRSAREAEAGLSRWVRLTIIVGLVIILLLVAMLIVGSGGHQIPRHGL